MFRDRNVQRLTSENGGVKAMRQWPALDRGPCVATEGLARMKIPSMTTGDFTPHFSLKNMLKDAKYALELATEHGLDLPALFAATACMQDQADAGQGENDFSVLVTKYSLQG